MAAPVPPNDTTPTTVVLPPWAKNRQVKPTATTIPAPKETPIVTPKTTPSTAVLPPWAKNRSTTTPTTVPTTTGPTLPIKPVPSPILEAELRGAQRDLTQATRAAERYGVPAQTIENIVEQKEPNVGLKILGNILNFAPIKYGVLKPLEIVDIGRRAVVGTLSPNVGIVEAIKDPTLGSKEAFNINVGDFKGSGAIEALLGFGTDVLFDPVTYLTFGVGGVVKGAAAGLAREGAMVTTKGITRTVIKEAGETAVRNADEGARFAGTFLDDAERAAIRKSAEATARESEELLAKFTPKALAASPARAAAVKAAQTAQRIGPRRVIGARSREELAQVAREVRDVAVQSGNEYVARTLTDDVIGDLATRGYSAARGDVARALGLRGGIRFGVGPVKAIVPGTERIADSFGQALTAIRIGAKTPLKTPLSNLPYLRSSLAFVNKGFVGTRLGNAIVRNTTPIGEGGLFGSEDILRMRTALRTGQIEGRKLAGEEADDFVRLLSQDRAFRNLKGNAQADADALLRPVFASRGYQTYANSVIDLLDNTAIGENLATMTAADATRILRAAGLKGRTVSDAELEVARNLRVAGDEFYKRANYLYERAQLMAGIAPENLRQLPKNRAWFPHTLSDNARRAISTGKITDETLEKVGVDRSFAMAGTLLRQLKVGSIWFGRKLTQQDINGGVKRLNEIASPTLGFDFFETNAEAAFRKYANGWSRDTAYTDFLYNMALVTEARRGLKDTPLGKMAEALAGGQFAGKAYEGEITQELTSLVTGVQAPRKLQAFSDAINDVLTPERVRALDNIPTAKAEMQRIADDIAAIDANITKRVSAGGVVFSNEINFALNDLEQRIIDLERLVDTAGMPSGFGAAMTSEASALLQSLRNQADGLRLNIQSVDPKKWANTVPIFLESANRFLKVNAINYPGLVGSPQFTELIQNFRQLEDPVVARAMQRATGGLTQMFKAWVTATPGFHIRNAMSNAFFGLSAGARMDNVIEAAKIFSAYGRFLSRRGLTEQLTSADDAIFREAFGSQTMADFVASPEAAKLGLDETVGPGLTKLDILINANTSGFGQTAEIFDTAGKLGISGRVQGRTGVLPSVSRAVGKPLAASRKAGAFVEGYSRFMLLYDGVKQGLSPEQAAARTAKYLIDYQDISRADQVLKQFIPFWMWTSRSFPLILESSWANPRAYAIWNNFTRNLRDEEAEQGQVRPSYLRPAIPVGGNVLFNPDFGFQRQEEGFANITDPRSLLASLTPVIRAPLETSLNQEFRTGEQLYSPYYEGAAGAEADYIARTVFPQLTSVGRATNAGIGALQQLANLAGTEIPGQKQARPELQAALERIALAPQQLPPELRSVLGIGKPAYIQDEQGPMYSEESLNRLLSFLGVPVTTLQPYQQTSTIKRLIERLEQETTRAKEEKEKQRRQKK